ncbi:serine hydrolase domain-containing protein [Solwaraspora sp. WMMA2065]|uniref:serine hydrolase domain-containing protein n=1 Tax=Solwaraspora sp. WMMA2065 TaxID=3015166 RepID=UPI00259B9AAF|nr:serine hydrolase domain-containing protein [Solwaraspora sp. WMMA2065]WJK34938.1 serine hydrolase domain-containing protein [Solwaraspora sp. WMMA2065]
MTTEERPGSTPDHTVAGLLPTTRRALLHRLAVGQVDGRAPSMVAAVVRADGLVRAAGRGEVDHGTPDAATSYRIGSISKTFTAVQVLLLREAGRLELTDPIQRHLPGCGVAATVEQLLAHTGGLPAEPPGPWWERTPGELRPELSDVLGPASDRRPAGHRYRYSNPGYALLGALIERLSGHRCGDHLRQALLDPLGMSATGAEPSGRHATGWAVHPWADVLLPEPTPQYGHLAPAGQLWSTAADLGRLAAVLLGADTRLLSADSLARMRTPASPPESADPDCGYGLGLQLLRHEGLELAGHTGSVPGFLAALWTCPDQDVAAVVLANVTTGPQIDEIAADLVKIVADREPVIPPPWRPATDVDLALVDLTGPWYWGARPVALRLLGDGTLQLTPIGVANRGTQFRRTADDRWLGFKGFYADETLRVCRDAAGAVSHLDLGTLVLTRGPYQPATAVPGGVDPAGWRAGSGQPTTGTGRSVNGSAG